MSDLTLSPGVGIRVVTENIQRLVRHANSCYFTMVAVDAGRKPVEVPALLRKQSRQMVHDGARKG